MKASFANSLEGIDWAASAWALDALPDPDANWHTAERKWSNLTTAEQQQFEQSLPHHLQQAARYNKPFYAQATSIRAAFRKANGLDASATDDADFKEEEHPREDDGKFGSKGGGGSSAGSSAGPEPAKSEGPFMQRLRQANAEGGAAGAKKELAKLLKESKLHYSDALKLKREADKAFGIGIEKKEKPQAEKKAEPEATGEEDDEEAAEERAKKSTHLTEANPNRDEWPEHIKKLVVPPAWTDVRLSESPDADLLVTGHDKKGRKQYVYSEKFQNSQAALKYARMESLRQDKPKIEGQLAEMQKSADKKTRDHADRATLVMKMGIRPGSDTDTQADKKAYGASTLEGQHVVEKNGQVFLRFVGKKGVDLNLPVEDPALAANLSSRAKKAGSNGRLFGDVYSGSLLNFVKGELDGGGYKTKDFRTLLANELAAKALQGVKPPKDAKQYKAAVKEVATQVSSRLGNTPTVALQSYIHPSVFGEWKAAADVPAKPKRKKKRKAKVKKGAAHAGTQAQAA